MVFTWAVLFATHSAHAFYNPSTGRWLSRDPINEDGGITLYVHCHNNLVDHIDLLGLWKIERKWKARAIAYAEEGDTIRRLAGKVRLNAREWKKWLKPEEVYTRPYDLDTPLTSCDSFSVPNTAYVDVTDYTLGWMRFWFLRYRFALQSRWVQEGYSVKYSHYSVTKDLILAHLNDPDLYAYAYMGHGATGYLIVDVDEKTWVKEDRYTPFGIVEMQLIACETDNGASVWNSNVSRDGLLITVSGDLNYWQQDLRVHSGQE